MLAMSIMPHQLETVQLLVDRGCPLEQAMTRAVSRQLCGMDMFISSRSGLL